MSDVATLNMLDPALYEAGRPEDNGLPLDLYDYLREERPCFRQELPEPEFVDRTWVVTRYDDVSAVCTDDERFTSELGMTIRAFDPSVRGHGGKPSLLTRDGSDHTRLRRIINRGFTPRALGRLEHYLRRVATEVLDKALPLGTFDFVEEVARQLPMKAICDLLGVPEESRPKVIAWADTIVSPSDAERSGGLEGMLEAANGIFAYALELADARRAQPTEDVAMTLVAARDSGEMDDDELMGMVMTLAVAGNETTRNAISHGMHALVRHPDQWELLRARTDQVIGTAVEEILRVSVPAMNFSRRASVEFEFHGEMIQPGDVVTFSNASANFDPHVFVDPRRFDLRRQPNQHMSFGRGHHFCLGANLARLEIRIMFEELIKRISRVELAGPAQYAHDAILHGCHGLPITVTT